MANAKRNQSAKGNPAAHRMSNEGRKVTRQRRYRNGKLRADARRAAQNARHAANLRLHEQGKLTPWETACAKRAHLRAIAA